MSEVITCVGLIKPMEGIFLEKVKYLMVVATAGEITILAVMYDKQQNQVNLTSTPSIVNAEDITITKITGSHKGRIFLGTADGNLCELKYDAEVERSWVPILSDVSNIFNRVTLGSGFNNDEPRPKFRKIKHNSWSIVIKRLKETQKGLTSLFSNNSIDKVQTNLADYKLVDKSVNHLVVDNERNILYVVSLNQLKVFSLGDDGMKTDALCLNDHDIINRIITNKLVKINDIRQNGNLSFKIVSLTPIKKIESNDIDFMVVLNTGLRVYLKLVPKISFSLPDWDVDVIYIKKPAPDTALNDWSENKVNGNSYEPDKAFISNSEVKYSACFNGTIISATSITKQDEKLCLTLKKRENDILGITLDYKENSYYDENICLINLENLMQDSRSNIPFTKDIQDIAEEIPEDDGGYFQLFYDGAKKGLFNEVRDELVQKQRKFMCLTLTDLHFFVKQRPVDVLYFILSSGSPNNELTNFFQHYGTVNACTVCFALTYHHFKENFIVNAAMKVALEKGGSPSIDHSGQFIPSSLHNSLYLYASRLLTPIWYIEVYRLKDHYFSEQIFLNALSEPISSLCLLLKNDRTNFSFVNEKENYANSHDPKKKEHSSIRELYKLLNRALEIIRLVKCLCIFESEDLIDENWINSLCDSSGNGYTFRDCVTLTEVKDKIQLLIFDVIKQLTENPSDEIDDKVLSLHEQSPNYLTLGDLLLYKGLKGCRDMRHTIENFKESSKYWNEVDVNNNKTNSKLHELCEKLKKIPDSMSLTYLIQLCIHAGLNFDQRYDICDDVVSYKRMNDKDMRAKCKKDCFDELWKHYYVTFPKETKTFFISEAIRFGNDALFQRLLCEYLYSNDREELLGFSGDCGNPNFIETYLKEDFAKILDLYRYYEEFHEMHMEAGQLMKDIGTSREIINISKRIDYLQKAQTSYSHYEGSRGLNEVTYLLNFAKLQKEAYDTIHHNLVAYLTEEKEEEVVPETIVKEMDNEEENVGQQYDGLINYILGPNVQFILSDAQREHIISLARLANSLNSRLFRDLELFEDVADKYKLIELSLQIIVQNKHLESNRSQLLHDYMKSYIYSLIPQRATSSACELFLRTKRLEVFDNFTSINVSGEFDNVNSWLVSSNPNKPTPFEDEIVKLVKYLVKRMDKDMYGNIVNIRTRNELDCIVNVIVTELEEITSTLACSNIQIFKSIEIGKTGSILRKMEVHRLTIVNSFHNLLHDWTGQSLDKRAHVACSISFELQQWLKDAKVNQQARFEIETSISSVQDILNSLSITMHSLATNYKIKKSFYNERIQEANKELKNVTEEVRKQYRH